MASETDAALVARIEKLEKRVKRQGWCFGRTNILEWTFFTFVSHALGWVATTWICGVIVLLCLLSLMKGDDEPKTDLPNAPPEPTLTDEEWEEKYGPSACPPSRY